MDILALINQEPNLQKEIKNSFRDFSYALRIANADAMQNNIKLLKSKIEFFKKSDNKIIKLISKDLESFINRLDKKPLSNFQITLTQWFYENKNYAMSYIVLAEAIITKLIEVKGVENTFEEREEVKKALKAKQAPQSDMEKLSKRYKTINQIRINIAHQTLNRGGGIINDIENLPKYIDEMKQLFKKI